MISIDASKNTNYPDRRYINILYKDPSGRRKKFGTKISIKREEWDYDTHRINNLHDDYEFQNMKIEERLEEVKNARKHFYLERGREPSCAELEEEVEKMQIKTLPIEDVLEMYLEACKRRGLTDSTMRKKQTLKTILLDIQEMRRSPILISEISHTFAQEMAMGLTDGYLSPKRMPLRSSSVKQYLTELSTFLEWCRIAHGLHKNHDHKDFVKKSNEYLRTLIAKKVTMSHEEWMRIYEVDISQMEAYGCTESNRRMAIDAVVLGYLLGRRIGEIITMEMSDIITEKLDSGDDFRIFTNVAKKVSKPFIVPVNKLAWEIITKQGHEIGRIFRPTILDDSFAGLCTRVIKEAAKIAGISDEVTIRYAMGNQIIEEKGPKWKFVCAHCGRSDFGNRILRENMGKSVNMTRLIQSLYGHSSIKTSEGYLENNPLWMVHKMKEINI